MSMAATGVSGRECATRLQNVKNCILVSLNHDSGHIRLYGQSLEIVSQSRTEQASSAPT